MEPSSALSPNDHGDAGDAPAPVTVQLADGTAMVRGALASHLAQDKTIEVVAATSTLEETLRAVGGHKPMVVVYQPPRLGDVRGHR